MNMGLLSTSSLRPASAPAATEQQSEQQPGAAELAAATNDRAESNIPPRAEMPDVFKGAPLAPRRSSGVPPRTSLSTLEPIESSDVDFDHEDDDEDKVKDEEQEKNGERGAEEIGTEKTQQQHSETTEESTGNGGGDQEAVAYTTVPGPQNNQEGTSQSIPVEMPDAATGQEHDASAAEAEVALNAADIADTADAGAGAADTSSYC